MSVCRLTVLNMKAISTTLRKRLSLFHSTAFFLCWFYLCQSALGFCILFHGFICQFFQLYHTVWIAIALSVHFSHSVMSSSLWPQGLQQTSLPCPLPIPQACSNSRPLSWWCHPTISSSIVPLSSWLQSLPASRSFSASASVLPMNIQDWFPLGWTGWISLQSKGLSGVFSDTTVQKHQFFGTQFSL